MRFGSHNVTVSILLVALTYFWQGVNSFTVGNPLIVSINESQLQMVSSSNDDVASRRMALSGILFGGAALVLTPFGNRANALDMDAFINAQLESDTKNCDPKRDPKCIPKLTQDEALCKYGQSGTARGEACKRVKEAGGTLDKPGSQGRSLGGAYAM